MRPSYFPALFREASRVLRLSTFVTVPFLAGAGEFYVSPSGRDTNPGTAEKPFGTLERARDEAGELNAGTARAPVTIWLAGGDYVRTHSFDLTVAEAGTAPAPVVKRAAKDQFR